MTKDSIFLYFINICAHLSPRKAMIKVPQNYKNISTWRQCVWFSSKASTIWLSQSSLNRFSCIEDIIKLIKNSFKIAPKLLQLINLNRFIPPMAVYPLKLSLSVSPWGSLILWTCWKGIVSWLKKVDKHNCGLHQVTLSQGSTHQHKNCILCLFVVSLSSIWNKL